MKPLLIGLAGMVGALVLATAGSAAAQDSPPSDCAAGAKLKYICGLKAPEDLVQVPGTHWVIASGLANAADPKSTDPGELALIDAQARTGARVEFKAGPQLAPYDKCPGPPDPAHLSTHGLNIRPTGRGKSRLFVVGHGGREAIEVFDVSAGHRAPTLTWIGCIPAPAGAFHNSVAPLRDGRVVVTDFLHSPASFRDFASGKPTGAVYVWKPGGVLEKLPGTDLSGANGVEATPDGRYLFVAVSGTGKVLRYELADTTKAPAVIDPGERTDNIRWGPDGKLLLAGPDMRGCKPGDNRCSGLLSVVALDPQTLAVTPVLSTPPEPAFRNLSSALIVGKTLWLGSPRDDRVAYTELPQ